MSRRTSFKSKMPARPGTAQSDWYLGIPCRCPGLFVPRRSSARPLRWNNRSKFFFFLFFLDPLTKDTQRPKNEDTSMTQRTVGVTACDAVKNLLFPRISKTLTCRCALWTAEIYGDSNSRSNCVSPSGRTLMFAQFSLSG